MDFKQLPASEGFSAILVIIDQLTKQVIFIPSHDTMNALQVAWLFLNHVFSKHRVLVHITLDWGSVTTSSPRDGVGPEAGRLGPTPSLGELVVTEPQRR